MSRYVNGWDEEVDEMTGEIYYRCHDCLRREGDGHDKGCRDFDEDNESDS